jgi:bacillithiol biosynthesis deacetylase BshB1
MADVVCVGAHPDDVEIGMGATVARMVRQGLAVTVVDLTDGEPTPHGTPEIRAREAAGASSALGVERVTLALPNRELQDTLDARRRLAEVIRERAPRWLFAPYAVDAHPDHVAASAICDAARFWAKLTKSGMRGEPHYPAKLYRYLAVHLRILAKPSFVVDVSEELETKLAALACYRSQFEANERNRGILDLVRLQAEHWGALIGREAGEPFFSAEEIGVSDIRHIL